MAKAEQESNSDAVSQDDLSELQGLLDAPEDSGEVVAVTDEKQDGELAADEPDEVTEGESEGESGDEVDGAEAEPAGEPAAPDATEGPSYAMQFLARQSGVPDWQIEMAQTDAQLQIAIANAPKAAPEVNEEEQQKKQEEEFLFSLPEDFDEEADPLDINAKTVRLLVEHVNKQMKRLAEVDNALLKDAIGRHKREEETEKSRAADSAAKIQKSMDKVLDRYESEVFGKSMTLKKEQFDTRSIIWESLMDLGKRTGLSDSTDAAEVERLTESVVSALHHDLVANRRSADDARRRQSKTVLGGRSSKNAAPSRTQSEELSRLEDYLNGKIDGHALLNSHN